MSSGGCALMRMIRADLWQRKLRGVVQAEPERADWAAEARPGR